MTNLYRQHATMLELEPHYSAHVSAMTAEDLHSKSDIAAELAFRDAKIAELENQLRSSQGKKHCETCICEKRAPVQGSMFKPSLRMSNPLEKRSPGSPGYGPGTISWSEHLLAYSAYANMYGTSQSAERIAERCGFSWNELCEFLGREPQTWKAR